MTLDYRELEGDLYKLDDDELEQKHGAPIEELRRALRQANSTAPTEVEVAGVQPQVVCLCHRSAVKCRYCQQKMAGGMNYCPHCGHPTAIFLNEKETDRGHHS